MKNKRLFIITAIWSALFVFCILTGRILQEQGDICWQDREFVVKSILLPGIVLTAVLTCIFASPAVRRFPVKIFSGGERIGFRKGKYFCLIAALLFIAWLPCGLAYYPGIFDYDVMSQIPQGIIQGFSKHHPLLHTWLLNNLYLFGVYYLGSGTAGIALYTILQMLVLAGCLSYGVVYLYQIGMDRKICIALCIWFAFFPVHAILSVSTTKDVLFSGIFFVFFILIYDTVIKHSNKSKIPCICCGVLALLLRNNMAYAMLAFLLLAFCVWILQKRETEIKGFVTIAALTVLVFLVMDKGMTAALHARNGSALEMLAVPIQQVARVYNYNEMDAEDKELLYQIVSETTLNNYSPHLADNVKFGIRESQLKRNFRKYFDLYVKYARRYPGTYVNAFLELTRGYWYLNDTSHIYIYGSANYLEYGIRDVSELQGLPTVQRTVYLPKVKAFYDKAAQGEWVKTIPVLSQIFAPAAYVWLMAAMWFYVIYQKKKQYILWLLLPMLYAATLFLGPAVLVRYVYVFYLIVPAAGAMIISAEDDR